MRAIEVKIDGKRLCLAGNQPGCFTFAQVDLGEREGVEETVILVGGIRGANVALWAEQVEIPLGAEISIRVVDAEQEDEPKLQPFSPQSVVKKMNEAYPPDQPCHSN